jgi:hypothetical protein
VPATRTRGKQTYLGFLDVAADPNL